jgi:hypothetical protein
MKRTVTLILALFLLLPLAGAQEPVSFLQLVGKVLDGATGKPLHYASVNLSGTNVSNVTNAEGVFTLKVSTATPPTLLVTVSHLSYATATLKVADFQGRNLDKPLEIKLYPISLSLSPALIRAHDPEQLMLAALFRIKQNYPEEHVGMTAFYREMVRKGNTKYLTMNEAVVDIDKAPYTGFQNDRIGIYKGRGSQNYDSSDTLFIKYQGGVTTILEIDQAKNPFANVNMSDIQQYYDFTMDGVEYLDDRMFYVVSFNQKTYLDQILMRGRAFIDSESLAFGRVELNMNVEGREDAVNIFILKKPQDTRFEVESAQYTINYKLLEDGKWYYDYARMEMKFATRKKRSLFKHHYTVMSEIAVTDHLPAPRKIEGEARMRFRDQLTEKVSAFTDANFWEGYNVIEPDAQIEAIIRKIVRQLKKHNLE